MVKVKFKYKMMVMEFLQMKWKKLQLKEIHQRFINFNKYNK